MTLPQAHTRAMRDAEAARLRRDDDIAFGIVVVVAIVAVLSWLPLFIVWAVWVAASAGVLR